MGKVLSESNNENTRDLKSSAIRFIWFGDGLTCSGCQSMSAKRINRSNWMRMFPNSRLLECNDCQAQRLIIFG